MARNRRHKFCGSVVRKMAMPGQDPLLDRPRSSAVFLQHPLVVVSFDNQSVHLPDALQRELWRVAEIGQKPDGTLSRGEDKGCRINRIMRHIKTLYLDVFHQKNATRCKQVPVWKIGQRTLA